MPINFDKVDDKVYRGGKPNTSDLHLLKNVFGINRIISLDRDAGLSIAPYVKSLGIEHIIMPISYEGCDNIINSLKNNIVSLLTDNSPTYIRCLYGKDRTGLAIIFYRMKTGYSKEQALQEADKYGFCKGLHPDTDKYYKSFIDTPDENEVNDDDITESMRDYFEAGANSPAFVAQQSWAPDMDIENVPIRQSLTPDEIKKFRKMMFENIYNGKDILQDVPIPEVGEYDNYSGIRGVGPVENQGILNI
jgi:hypothetical protein